MNKCVNEYVFKICEWTNVWKKYESSKINAKINVQHRDKQIN